MGVTGRVGDIGVTVGTGNIGVTWGTGYIEVTGWYWRDRIYRGKGVTGVLEIYELQGVFKI